MSVFDLSRWQPADRIQELVDGGNCEGVILKLGERNVDTGEIELDPMFITHVNEAVRLGQPYGIYLMSRARNAEEAIEEAQWINDKVAELLNGEEPVLGTWWDLERKEVIREDIWPDIRDAIGTMQSWWNSDKIGVYASQYYLEQYVGANELAYYGIPVWEAQYGNVNKFRDDHPELRHILWQFTTNNNYQDENIWYGW